MKFKGKVTHVTPTENGEDKKGNQTMKNNFVVEETEGKYPSKILINQYKSGEHVQYFKEVNVGEVVEVEYSTTVSEYNGKHYGNNNMFRLEVIEKADFIDAPY
jgi:hypothetical protein